MLKKKIKLFVFVCLSICLCLSLIACSRSDGYDKETGLYRHKIGEQEFFTEHNLNDYINGKTIDIEKMFRDVCEIGQDEMLFYAGNGLGYINPNTLESSATVVYYYKNGDTLFPTFEVLGDYYSNGVAVHFYEEKIKKNFIYIKEAPEVGMTREMYEIVLYILEQEASSRDDKQNIMEDLSDLPFEYYPVRS